MNLSKEEMQKLSHEAALQPQEQLQAVAQKEGKLFIGIPREISFQETRVALAPLAVQLLVNNGHRVVVERSAGAHCKFSDQDYSEAGAEIADGPKEVYEANVIMKVAPPSMKEIGLMKTNQTLISSLQVSTLKKECLQKLMEKRITAIAWDYIMDEAGVLIIVRAMGEIAGNTSILIAGELMSHTHNGTGAMLGGITGVSPSEVVIIGAGTVGEYAARAALGLGASVKVFDNSLYRLRRLQNDIGQRIWTSTIQPKVLEKALMRCDVAIGAMRAAEGRTPSIVNEAMVEKMKSGAVVVDVSIDQGGCFETSQVTNHNSPTFVHHDVIHYCVPNINSRVPRTASYALSNIFAPNLIEMGEGGGIDNIIRNYSGVRDGVYLFKGSLTNEDLGDIYDLTYKNLDLILAAF